MHFALPPRKTSKPPAYAGFRPVSTSWTRRIGGRTIAILGILFFVLCYVLFGSGRRGGASVFSTSQKIPPGTPPVVLVTLFDHTFGHEYEEMIRRNREVYAQRHGYTTFYPNISDYSLTNPVIKDLELPPRSWAKLPALRHALTKFPHSSYLFYLDQHALIMRPDLSLHEHVLAAPRLQKLMLVDHPVVPPESVIHTFKNTRAEHVAFILTQDNEGLSPHSFIVRHGEWAKFLLDSWFDPLYRSYNFQKAEAHALEHLVQWHGTILQKLAIVPQRILNSYVRSEHPQERYADGDFVAHFFGCDVLAAGRSCPNEVKPMFDKFVRHLPQSEAE